MALKVIDKINSTLKFLHRKNNYLAVTVGKKINKKLNANCAKWMKSILPATKKKLLIFKTEVESLNWLKDRINQPINSTFFKCFTYFCPS